MTIRAAVFAFLDQQIKPINLCVSFIVWVAYNYTSLGDIKRKHVMACVREYADISGASVKCINRSYGIYRFTPGVKVGKAIVD